MVVDYYTTLKVGKDAGEEELRRSYKKLAMRWHPDKHPSISKGLAETKFKQICEAYDVLSDPTKRQIYDVYGEEGLKYNVSSPSAAATRRRGGSFRGGDVVDDVDDIFDEFLGGYDGGSDKSRSPKSDNIEYKDDVKNNTNNNNHNNVKNHKSKSDYDDEDDDGSYRSGGRTRQSSPLGNKAAPIENKLACTLEELYKGSKRKMMISRIVPDDSGKPRTVEEVLAIDIKPGWKRGTKITFPGKGNQVPDQLPGDMIFVIDEKPHSTFKRDGNDLVVSQRISLVDALTGKTLNLTTLDGRNLTIDVTDVVKPGHEIVIPGEGMPISKDPRKKGNLKIKFDVKFPSRLSADQKADIRRVFSRS